MANKNEATTSRLTVNPDLQRERDTSTINSLEITNFIDGGKEKTERRRQFGRYKNDIRHYLHCTDYYYSSL